MSTKIATLAELGTVYSLKDAYDLMEISLVDLYNRKRLSKGQQ